MQAKLTSRFAIAASVGWTHARYVRYSGCDTVAPTDCDGNRLNRAPDATASLRADYSLPVGVHIIRFSPDLSYTGNTFFDARNQPESKRPDFVLINGEIALEFQGGWSVGAYVRNLADKDYFTDSVNSPQPDGSTEWRYGAAPPRTFGIRARLGF